jgi:hypothetical protein
MTFDFGPQLEIFLQRYPFAGPRVIANQFFTSVLTVKDILQRVLGMTKVSRRWVPHFRSPGQNGARVEASKEMLRIVQEFKANHFDGIATSDESQFRYFDPCSKIFARSLAKFILRTRSSIGEKQTMITIFFAARKLIIFVVLPKGSKSSPRYFINYAFRIWKIQPGFSFLHATIDFFGEGG